MTRCATVPPEPRGRSTWIVTSGTVLSARPTTADRCAPGLPFKSRCEECPRSSGPGGTSPQSRVQRGEGAGAVVLLEGVHDAVHPAVGEALRVEGRDEEARRQGEDADGQHLDAVAEAAGVEGDATARHGASRHRDRRGEGEHHPHDEGGGTALGEARDEARRRGRGREDSAREEGEDERGTT